MDCHGLRPRNDVARPYVIVGLDPTICFTIDSSYVFRYTLSL